MSNLENGSVVWVRLGQAWWPGTVTTLEKCPPEFVQGIRKTPVAVVKFFHENEFQDVHKAEHIYPYSCERKEEFIRRGLYVHKNLSHGDVDLLSKFESDVVTAEKLTGGDMDILQTIGEVADVPTSSPDGLSSISKNTDFERPLGCLPGEVEFGEPVGQTQIEANSSRMRSPHSYSKQQALRDSEASSKHINQFNEHFAKEEEVVLGDSECTLGRTDAVVPLPKEPSILRGIPSESNTLSVVRDTDKSDRAPVYVDPPNSSREVECSDGTEQLYTLQNRMATHKSLGTNHKDEVCQLPGTAVEPDSNVSKSDSYMGEDIAETLPESSNTVDGNSEDPFESKEIICKQTDIGKLEFKRAPSHAVESHHADSVSTINNGRSPVANPNGKSFDSVDDGFCDSFKSQNVEFRNESKDALGDSVFQKKDNKSGSEILHSTINHKDNTPETCPVSKGNIKAKYKDQDETVQSRDYPADDVVRSSDQIVDSKNVVSEMQVTKIDADETDVEELGKQLATQSSSIKANLVNEMDDDSDSEPRVSSSGVRGYDDGEELDDSVDDDLSNSGLSEHLKLDDSVEDESSLDRTSNEVRKSDLDLVASKMDVSEAESSPLVSGLNNLVQGSSKDTCSEAESAISRDELDMEMVDETLKKVEEDSQSKRTKRQRKSSEGKNKRQRVKKKEEKDTEQEEEELPDLVAAANADKRSPRLNAGDLVWVKYRKDWWPSYIKNVYPKERKFSIYFIACDQKAGIKVGQRNIKKLFIFDVPSFVNQNQEGFSAALHLCKLFHRLQESGNKISAHDFFSLSPQDQVGLLNPRLSSQKKLPSQKAVKTKSEKRANSNSAYKTPSGSPKEKSTMSARDRNKLQSAIKARRADNIKLVRFMKSRQCLDHLWKIFDGEIPCKRHDDYQDERLRKDLLWTGIGPFQLDEEDEQIMSVIEFLKEEIKSKRPEFQNWNDYPFRVWMPEAIKEALRVVKKVPENELDEALDKGYRETAIEKKGDEAL